MQINVSHSSSTLFDASGSSNIVSKLLLVFLESQGHDDNDEQELFSTIFGKCVDAILGEPSFLWVGDYLINFDQ